MLMFAAAKGYTGVCIRLVELGASLDAVDAVKHLSCYFDSGLLQDLTRTNFFFNLFPNHDQCNKTALILAAERGYVETCANLIPLGADPNFEDSVSLISRSYDFLQDLGDVYRMFPRCVLCQFPRMVAALVLRLRIVETPQLELMPTLFQLLQD